MAANRAIYEAYRAAALSARALPGPLATALGRTMGGALSGTMRQRRAMIGRHLRRVDPTLEGVALRRAVQRAFDSYARYWVDSFRLADATPASLAAGMEAEGLEHFEAARDEGRGTIALLAHLGGWDFGGAYLASLGYRITVVAERLEPPELFDWFVEMRRRLGIEVVAHDDGAGPAVLAALKRNEIVGLVADRDLDGNGVEVEFFGERTTLPSGPALLALRTGAPIVPVSSYFAGPRRHRGVVHPPIPGVVRKGRLRDDVARVTQLVAQALESMIREAPDQWHLFQPNWPSDREWLARHAPGAPR